MRRSFAALRSLFGIDSAAQPMPSSEFTEEVARRVRASLPDLDVEVVNELELAIATAAGGSNRAFLNNAYHMYKSESEQDRNDLIDRFVRSFVEGVGELQRSRDAIIPIVKDRAWLQEIHRSMQEMGADHPQEHVYEDLNDELIVVYAVDTPNNIAYISPGDLGELGVDRSELRALAVRNLRGLLPGIGVHRGDLMSMVTADGNYEASLLLFSDLWERERERLRGEPVAAVPARDVLVFADSADPDAISQLRQLAAKLHQEATYSLTNKLFVIRGGRIEAWAG